MSGRKIDHPPSRCGDRSADRHGRRSSYRLMTVQAPALGKPSGNHRHDDAGEPSGMVWSNGMERATGASGHSAIRFPFVVRFCSSKPPNHIHASDQVVPRHQIPRRE
jgi:hypothetical protein